jgi:hypothetical protein
MAFALRSKIFRNMTKLEFIHYMQSEILINTSSNGRFVVSDGVSPLNINH